MSVISEEEKINSSLVADLKASAVLTYNDADAATIGSIAAAMPDTNLKMQSIIKDLTFNWLGPIPNAGEEIASSSVHPNYHVIKAVISTTQASKCASVLGPDTSDPRSELYYHANMVVLVKHSFIFEKTVSTCNVQSFYTELGIAADIPVVDGAIAFDCPYMKTTYVLILGNALLLVLLLIKTLLLRLWVNILVCSKLNLTALPNVIGKLVITPLLMVGV